MEQIIHISDAGFDLRFYVLCDTPGTLIEEIRKNYANSILFLINVNYKTKNIDRADNAGILLLKYLRLYHLRQHCILYSFLSREQLIMQNPHNLIIYSKGVTFIQMPEDLSKLDYVELAKKHAPVDLSEYFRAGFSFPEDNRHNWANWWGIERLWQVHQAVIGKNKEDIDNYKRSQFLKKMQSIEALTALYLYPINIDKIKEVQRESAIQKLKREISAWNYLIAQEGKKKDCDNCLIIRLKENINKHEKSVNDIRKKYDEGEYITTLRNKIATNPRKIVLIDDQSEEGWETIFKNMLYNNNNALYNHLSAPAINDTGTCLQHIKQDTDIVLLDLRLKNEQGSFHDVSQLSGVELLKKIIERHPGLPVVIITASNKFRSYQTIMDLGADAYWVKEGLDSRFNEKETFENYKLFLDIIQILSGKEYKLLKDFSRCLNQIKKTPQPWWAIHQWSNPYGKNNIQIQSSHGQYKSIVTELLDYGVMLFRNWLKMFILNPPVDYHNENKLLANIINTLGGVVEAIHNKEGIKSFQIGAHIREDYIKHQRDDFLGFYIYCMRNYGSHFFNAHKIDYDLFEFYIKILITWLSVSYTRIDINDFGIKDKRGYDIVINNQKKLMETCENMILTRKKEGGYKYSGYANFYLNEFK